ncbi:PfkB family carbohydrate kinase [Propioniciclava sp. MC1595]|uniref:PfkB family carbohydrate kinase n=1 Tax=Propioniciclava sp. MC1595 TaxID=2760308 RepID=UPI0028AAC903|nr:PfkB family carbohydrate kinase [Propioniciclava sp. MC1595]
MVVTRGSSGALAAHANGLVTVPAPPVVVADTVGAGDSFMAALLAGFLDLGDDPRAMLTPASIEALLRQATAAAAITVGRVGANPPTREELASAAPA